jgi:maltose-binding protein MalE
MKQALFVVAIALVVLCLVCAGCTQPAPPATPTPTATATPATPETTVSPTAIPTLGFGTPGPTQALPPEYNLVFQITSNGNTAIPIMYVSLQGGQGINVDSQVQVTLTQPNGASQTQYMNQPFSMGQTLDFPCSQYQNRIEIWVIAPQLGQTKVYDEIVPFQSINP